LPTQLQVHGNGLPLAPDLQVQVLHVVQEALSNVRKHAAARQVGVTLWHEPALRIEVRDDGRGFAAASAAPDDTHVGLRIMRERAAGIGAEVQVHSVPGQGTCVTLSLPVAEPVPAAAPRPALA
jgi:two-component system nitrate/nitrite sensor histidine kinase NarX